MTSPIHNCWTCDLKEVWKDIPDFEGLYQASSFGKIRSLGHGCRKGKVLKPVCDSQGYPRIALYKDGKHYGRKVHRIIMLTFVGEREHSGIKINHIDGDKTNNNLFNLEYCTHSQNMRHASENGLLCKTGKRANFKSNDVYEICLENINGVSTERIAKSRNVDTATIRRILSNKSYKWVSRPKANI
jgi:hypothetical protein